MKNIKLFLLVILILASCATPATSAPVSMQTSTLKPTATQTLIPTTTPTATPVPTQIGGGSGKLIFNYAKTGGFEKSFPDIKGELNVFTANWDGTDITPITSGLNGYNHIESISPDGLKILVSSFPEEFLGYDSTGDLFLVYLDGSLEPQKIASGLYKPIGAQIAMWLNNTSMAFIASNQQTRGGVFIINSDGTGLRLISKSVSGAVLPFAILPTTDTTRIFWKGCAHTSYTICKGTWWSNTDGSGQSMLYAGDDDNIISPDGSMVVWNKPVHSQADCCAIYVSPTSEMDKPRSTLEKEGNNFQVIWYPNSSKVLLFRPTSDFSGTIYPFAAFILSPTDLTYKQINLPISKDSVTDIYIHDLSPDGRLILVTYEGGVTKILNLETMTFSEEFTNHITQDSTLGEQTWGVYWLPSTK